MASYWCCASSHVADDTALQIDGNILNAWKRAPKKKRRAVKSTEGQANCDAAGFWAETNFEIGFWD